MCVLVCTSQCLLMFRFLCASSRNSIANVVGYIMFYVPLFSDIFFTMMYCHSELCWHICKALLPVFLTLLRFVYRREREREEWKMLFCMSCITQSHLDKLCSHICLMFSDFSRTFNTIQPHLLAEKLLKMKVSISTICSGYSNILLIGFSLLNLALNFPTPYSPRDNTAIFSFFTIHCRLQEFS